MKKTVIIFLLILVLVPSVSFSLGKVDIVSRKRSGTPKNIGLIITSSYDPFVVQTTIAFKEKAAKQNINVVIVYTEKDPEEQMYEFNRLYTLYAISALVIESATEELTEEVNTYAIERQISVVYINESKELANFEIPEHRRIIKYTHSKDFSTHQLEYSKSYFEKNNIRSGTVLLLYNNNDPEQDKQANLIIKTFENKRNFDFNNFDIRYESLDTYHETLETVENWLTTTPNVVAMYSTNNTLAEWGAIGLRNYKIAKTNNTGVRARRSARQTRVLNRKRNSRSRNRSLTGTSRAGLDKLLVLSSSIQSSLFELIDEDHIHMSIYKNSNAFAEEILARSIHLAQGKAVISEEEYNPDIITSENIFRFAQELIEIKNIEEYNQIVIR